MIDLLAILLITWVLSMLLVLWVIVSPTWALALQALAFFLVQTLYAMVFEWCWRGRTLGKRAMGLRVIDERGLALRPGQVVIRNLLRAVDWLPACYLVGGAAVWLTRHCQRLGDLAAGTVVIRTQPVRSVRIEALLAGEFNSFRQYPVIEARLRQKASADDAGLALSALLRRDELEPACRLRVFRELVMHYRELAPFPLEATEGLTDEQYLRNVAETLFRRRGS
jgi:uncharacterized RDD family membrane protein YckC